MPKAPWTSLEPVAEVECYLSVLKSRPSSQQGLHHLGWLNTCKPTVQTLEPIGESVMLET